jgi:MoxR-like ATPase
MNKFDAIRTLLERVRAEIRKAVVGQDEGVDLLLAALLARGHVLLEGIPGTAKTLLCRTVAAALGGSFKASR